MKATRRGGQILRRCRSSGASSTYRADLAGGTSTASDRLHFVGAAPTGTVDLTTTSDVLSLMNIGPAISQAETYTIADNFNAYATGTNAFDTVLVDGVAAQSIDPAAANYAFVHYNPNSITVDVANVAPVPEPVALSVVGLGAMGLLSRRRRRTA